jgi:hypothetical protein
MREAEIATATIDALKAAQGEPPAVALSILNGLVGFVQGDGDQPLEVEEARSNAFLEVCEVAKALHRGQPAQQLWGPAIDAAERWVSLARSCRQF